MTNANQPKPPGALPQTPAAHQKAGLKKFSFQPLQAAIFLSCLAMASSAMAGGGGVDGATEMTQLANNAELVTGVAEQAEIVAKQTLQYMEALKQTQTMIQNLSPANIAAFASKLVVVKDQLNAAKAVFGAVSAVQTTTEQARRVLNTRYTEMAALKLSPRDYLLNEVQLAKQKGGIYQQQINSDLSALKRAQEKSQHLAEMNDEIGRIQGNVQGLHTLATQNQMMAGELAEINSSLTQERIRIYSEKKEAAQDQEAQKERDRAAAAALDAERERMQKVDRDSLDMLNATAIFNKSNAKDMNHTVKLVVVVATRSDSYPI